MIDVYEYYLRLYSGIKESIHRKSQVCCVHGGLQQKNLVSQSLFKDLRFESLAKLKNN